MKPPVAGQDFDVDVYGPVDLVAAVIGRSANTIRTWMHHELVRVRRDGAQVLVHVGDVARHSGEKKRRNRKSREAA